MALAATKTTEHSRETRVEAGKQRAASPRKRAGGSLAAWGVGGCKVVRLWIHSEDELTR